MKKIPMNSEPEHNIDENPVMILNSIARLFDVKARSVGVSGDITQNSCRLIMIVLSHFDGLSQLELVEKTHLKAPTVSIGLKKMETEGLVKRENDIHDMRVTRVFLTEKGKEYNKRNFQALQEIDKLILKNLTNDEIYTVTKILLKMRQNILDEVKRK